MPERNLHGLSKVRELFSTRESEENKRQQRRAALDEIGGLDAVRHIPLHEIEEKLGLDDAPQYDSRTGITYPSRNEMARQRDKLRQRTDKYLNQIDDRQRRTKEEEGLNRTQVIFRRMRQTIRRS